MQRRFLQYMMIALLPLAAAVSAADDLDFDAFWREPTVEEVPFDEVVLNQGAGDGIRWQEFVYTSMKYAGQPIRVHAVYAAPADLADGNRRPGLVVTHGWFGNASLDVIAPYARAGYPTVMWEWEIRYKPGQVTPPADGRVSLPYTYYPAALYPDGKYPRADSNDWKRTIWHPAVIAGRRAITWLQKRPGVDPDRIGAAGGSFGGQTTSLLAVVDPRVKAVVPFSFAPLSLASAAGLLQLPELSPQAKREYALRFDAAENLQRTKAAFYWQVGTHDRAFFPPAIYETYARTKPPRALWLLPNIDHIHPSEGAALAWFDTMLKGAPSFPEPGAIAVKVAANGVQVRLTPVARTPLTHVTVCWGDALADANRYTSVLWRAGAATRGDDGSWTATIRPPFGGTDKAIQVFVNVRDERGAVVSTAPTTEVNLGGYLPPAVSETQASAAEGLITIVHRQTDLAADGDVADWPTGAWTPPFGLQFVSGQSTAKPAPFTGTVGNADARLAAAWDGDNLYFALRVHSFFPLVNGGPKHSFWQGDSFQIRLYGGPGAEAGKAPGESDTVLHVYGWRSRDGQPVLKGEVAHGRGPAQPIADWGDAQLQLRPLPEGGGWSAEGRLPWKSLQLTPAAGMKLRLGLQINIGNETGDMLMGYCEYNHGQDFGRPAKWGQAVLSD